MIEEYKKISSRILEILKCKDIDEDLLEDKLDERQEIIDKLQEEELLQFKKDYHTEEIYELEEEIKHKLQEILFEVKKDLSDYRKKKAVNFVYANANKTNLNIFSKKV